MNDNAVIDMELQNVDRAHRRLQTYWCHDYVSIRKEFNGRLTSFSVAMMTSSYRGVKLR